MSVYNSFIFSHRSVRNTVDRTCLKTTSISTCTATIESSDWPISSSILSPMLLATSRESDWASSCRRCRSIHCTSLSSWFTPQLRPHFSGNWSRLIFSVCLSLVTHNTKFLFSSLAALHALEDFVVNRLFGYFADSVSGPTTPRTLPFCFTLRNTTIKVGSS